MSDGSQRGTKKIFIAWEHHTAIVVGAVSFPALAINGDALRTVHRVPVIQIVK
jgi:hypothetical protein